MDGEFWFVAAYAAKLLNTSRKKVEAMAMRELLRSRQDGNSFLIAESDVTYLRRNPDALKKIKQLVILPRNPKRTAKMPDSTLYVGEGKAAVAVRAAVGNPLADSGDRSKDR
ncbi:MAG: hypothetical protein C0510_11745 [Erythrobacter sp.]|nr:hypothetical protein [Erythrobacter sp.]